MRAKFLFLVVLGFSGLAFGIRPAHLVLGADDGCPVPCKVKRFDSEQSLVSASMGGSSTNIPLSRFEQRAQRMIQDFESDRIFCSTSSFRVKVNKESKKDSSTRRNDAEEVSLDLQLVHYDITLEQRVPADCGTLECDYTIFSKEEYKGFKDDQKEAFFKCCGHLESVIPEAGKVRMSTKEIAIRQAKISSSWTSGNISYSSEGNIKGRLEGVFVEISKLGWDGKRLTRTVELGAVPKKKKWTSYKEQK